MSANCRFEVRCTPEIFELAKALQRNKGDTTLSSLMRRLIKEEANRTRAEIGHPERSAVVRALAKVENGSDDA